MTYLWPDNTALLVGTDYEYATLYNPFPGYLPFGMTYGNNKWVTSFFNASEDAKLYVLDVSASQQVSMFSTWQEALLPTTSPIIIRDISYANGLFIAVGMYRLPYTGVILTSTDGYSWTLQEMVNRTILTVTYGNGIWVISGEQKQGVGSWTATSSTGTSWTITELPSVKLINSIGYGDNLWVAIAYSLSERGTILTSTDGIVWEDAPFQPFDISGSVTGPNTGSAIYADGVWMVSFIRNIYGPTLFATSPNGLFWTELKNHPFSNGVGRSIAYDVNNVWVVFGYSSSLTPITAKYSVISDTWTVIDLPVSSTDGVGIDVSHDNGVWLISGLYTPSTTTTTTTTTTIRPTTRRRKPTKPKKP